MGVEQGELIRTALEHQMIENDRTLIARMIESFGHQPHVERVVILDREGRVRYSSVPAAQNDDLHIGSPTCQACHRYPPERRGPSRVIETAGGTVLRTVVPFRNREQCHRCHDPARRINGILILDRDVSRCRAAIDRDLGWLVGARARPRSCSSGAIAAILRLASSAACSDSRHGPADRGGRPRAARAGRRVRHHLVARARVQRHGRLGDRPGRRGAEPARAARDGHQQHRRRDRRARRSRHVIAANDAFLARTGGKRETVRSGAVAATRASRAATSRSARPRPACGRASVRCACASGRRRTDRVRWEEIHASPDCRARRHGGARRRGLARHHESAGDGSVLAESHRLASLGLLASGFSHELNTPLATS